LAYNYLPEERETYFHYADDSDTCYIYTCSKTLMTKLDKLCKNFPDTYKLMKQDRYSKSYETSKKLISIRAPKTLSDEHIAKLQANAKKMHESN
jgi:hypothetical protein